MVVQKVWKRGRGHSGPFLSFQAKQADWLQYVLLLSLLPLAEVLLLSAHYPFQISRHLPWMPWMHGFAPLNLCSTLHPQKEAQNCILFFITEEFDTTTLSLCFKMNTHYWLATRTRSTWFKVSEGWEKIICRWHGDLFSLFGRAWEKICQVVQRQRLPPVFSTW